MTKTIREYPLEVQTIDNAIQAYMKKFPNTSAYFFIVLDEHEGKTSLDGGGFANPTHAAMLAQAIGTTLDESANNWKEPALKALAAIIMKTVGLLFGGGIKENTPVDNSKGMDH